MSDPYTTRTCFTARIAVDGRRIVICPVLKLHAACVEDPEMAEGFTATDRQGQDMKMVPGLAYRGFITWVQTSIGTPQVLRFSGYMSGI